MCDCSEGYVGDGILECNGKLLGVFKLVLK